MCMQVIDGEGLPVLPNNTLSRGYEKHHLEPPDSTCEGPLPQWYSQRSRPAETELDSVPRKWPKEEKPRVQDAMHDMLVLSSVADGPRSFSFSLNHLEAFVFTYNLCRL